MKDNRTYTNPVLTGFHPDPSIIRVGDDYYMANATFQYFPAIAISHSKDLVHWRIIGHGITEGLDLSDIKDSHGIWAPDLSYHDGTFYIFATFRLNGPTMINGKKLIRRQIMIKSDRPEGPYTKPVFIDEGSGIDPSHFVDDDGKHYMLLSPACTLFPLNDECTEITGAPSLIWEGTGRRAPEGPHLLKTNGYYYAILAEGGTGYSHSITIARSKHLYGPYEPCPHNPILTQANPDALLQRAGHGKLVKTQNGEWWAVYLCGRPNEGNFTTVGRETALDPVQWGEDDWFVINNLRGPSTIQAAPNLPEVKWEEKDFDDFLDDSLDLQWQFVRNPDHSGWSLTEKPGFLRLWTGDADLREIKAKNTIVRREKHHQYSAVLKLCFAPSKNGEQAGLTCYYSTNNYLKCCLIYEDRLKVKVIENRNGVQKTLGEKNVKEGPIYVKAVINKQTRNFYYSYEEKHWHHAGGTEDATFLSDEGARDEKGHTGTMVGMYANNGGSKRRIPADFDWFRYTAF
ncbi:MULTISPECIES: glycoside hydrolase family 43 protein [Bacillus]|uniref:Glycoside hydrolase family 43 protein n=2 Tax=Bacillus TaxID=1386 RepID=A0AAJ3YYL2_9BACI|nr:MULTISPECIES: glycoside hydrolase family 43 protein [Bacillus]KKB73608.1 glycoside hydrolase [Bacillus sp. TH008]MDU0072441.1 glycoside hydrolase family 43 protein [Bacillus sp. IG6]MED8020234.1 glycoside hydrolase family 43 protein [Bacillus glycinifermentans]QAT64310.1 glycoside hydrolase family 43 protein [Bacillus glycinifermentans]WKB78217.1 glycoside hydrolase family 43 protein [Bacillus glycinifermentans]